MNDRVSKKCKELWGGKQSDLRGTVRFINDFTLKRIKRFYQVENRNTSIIRGFHGHMKEEKYVYVAKGKILLCVAYLDNVKNPSKLNRVQRFVLSSDKPEIVYIPQRYANGFKTLEENSIVIFFSTLSLSNSLKDDYRFRYDYWGKDIWKNTNENI